MFTKILVPVDLAHVDNLSRALEVAADIALHYKASVTYVGVTAQTPGSLGHNPTEYAKHLAQFAQDQSKRYGFETAARAVVSHDPATDLDKSLARAVKEAGADLVVMATHVPNVVDHFWPSHGGKLATHTDASVFLVRG
ncbi:universal stress protein [Celeribacter halophilus]|uniref:Universal stress protein n=1 Tax=Celeribacter halophilus TaxID=576117 RepID=A0AAW7XX14_9RHOB|nr:universal stress protein [Celeribacter halophilus]MDO6458622.1 universal stress protein [Celeribacter halophilus]MDO6725052.1 universal stress protein [Celeribacter halophilus]